MLPSLLVKPCSGLAHTASWLIPAGWLMAGLNVDILGQKPWLQVLAPSSCLSCTMDAPGDLWCCFWPPLGLQIHGSRL